jgi:integrase
MAYLTKKKTVHYVDPDRKRVPKDTPGATKVTVLSEKWYICYRDGRGKNQSVPAYRDKKASDSKMKKLELAIERGQEGLLDPFEQHAGRAIIEHLEEYLPVFRERVTNKVYRVETERILRNFLKAVKIETLGELTGEVVETYLTRLTVAPNTKKKRHSAINGFVKWLHKRKRIPQNFMALVDVPRGGTKTPIRSLNADERQRVLDATRRRPLREALLIRHGPRKGELAADVRPEVRLELEQEGRERGLLYKTAMYTGLRKEELARLKVGHLNLDHQPPLIELQAENTKGKRDAKLLLVPALAQELKQLIVDTGKQDGDLLFRVPDKLNEIFVRDLKFAGIPARTEKGAARFRCLRKSANVMLSEAGIPLKARQLFMRHTDVRLTANTYDDAVLTDMVDIVPALEQHGPK